MTPKSDDTPTNPAFRAFPRLRPRESWDQEAKAKTHPPNGVTVSLTAEDAEALYRLLLDLSARGAAPSRELDQLYTPETTSAILATSCQLYKALRFNS